MTLVPLLLALTIVSSADESAINVHAPCLQIREIVAPTKILVRFMHDQAYGFELFRAGDALRFLKATTLDCGGETREMAALGTV